MTTLTVSILWTLGTVSALWLALRLRARPWIAFLLWLLPTLLLILDFNRQTLSAHGLLHASIVYDILERGLSVRPGHPLLGGEPLLYPWAHHWIAAVAARLFGVTPAAVFGATGLLSLALFGLVLDRAAREIDGDVRYRILAVALALFGSNPLLYGPLASLAARAGLPLEPRAMPWLKFLGVNSNHLGLLFTAMALLAILRAAASERPRPGVYVLAGVSMLGSAILYPMSFLTNGLWLAASAAWLALRSGPSGRARAFRLLAAATIGTLPALPYLWLISAGRSAAGALQVAPSPASVLRNSILLAGALALPVALLAAVRPASVLSERGERRGLAAVLIVCAAAAIAVFALGFINPLVAYKFLMAAMLPLGLLAAAPLRRLCAARPAPALACLIVLFLPLGARMGQGLADGWPAAQPLTNRGAWLEPLDPAERDLCRWIAASTPPGALFVDSRLTVPPFGRRPLFVALPQEPVPPGTHDGWGMPPEVILGSVTGADLERAERRRQLAAELLSPRTETLAQGILARLKEEAGGLAVYVVARDERIAARLTGGFRPVYRGPAGRVLQLITEPERSSR